MSNVKVSRGGPKGSAIFLNEISINKNQKNKNNGSHIESLAHLKEMLERGDNPVVQNDPVATESVQQIIVADQPAPVEATNTSEPTAPVTLPTPIVAPVAAPAPHHSRPVSSTNVTIKEKELLRQLLVDYVDFGFPLDKRYNSKGKALAELVRTLKPEYADSIAQRVQEEGGDRFADRLREHELSVRSKQLVFPAGMRSQTKETLKKVYIDFHTRHAHKDGLMDYETRLQNYCYRVAGHLQNLHKTHEFISSNFAYLAQPPAEVLPEGKRYSCPDKAGILQAVKNEVQDKGKKPSVSDTNLVKELEKNMPSQQQLFQMEEHDPSSPDSIVKMYHLGKHLLESVDFDSGLKTADEKIEALCSYIPHEDEAAIFRNLFGTTPEQKAGSLSLFRDDIVAKRLQTIGFESNGPISVAKQDRLHASLVNFHTQHADANILPDYHTRLAHFYFEIGMEIPDTRAAGNFIRENFPLLVQEKKKQKSMPSPDNTQIAFMIGVTSPPAGVDIESYKHMEVSYAKGKIHTLATADIREDDNTEITSEVDTISSATDSQMPDIETAETETTITSAAAEDVTAPAEASEIEETTQAEPSFTPPASDIAQEKPFAEPAEKQVQLIENKTDLLSLSSDAIQQVSFIIESFGDITKAAAAISTMKTSGLTLTEMVKVKEIENVYASFNPKAQNYFLASLKKQQQTL